MGTRPVDVAAAFGGKACPELESTRMCNTKACPVDCQVTGWADFGSCDKTCGWGHKKRTREVILGAQFGGNPCPELAEVMQCNLVPCPEEGKTCEMTNWSKQTDCSVTCGGGKQSQHRSVINRNGQATCPEVNKITKCNLQACPQDCVMADWSKWSQCSKSCGGKGTQRRHRRIITIGSDGGKACGAAEEHEECNMGPCPIHCKVSRWGVFSKCTKSCGSGSYTRTRSIVQTARHGGFVCPSLKEVEVCNWKQCPVDCVMEEWEAWSTCTKSCAKGVHTRHRKIITQAEHGGKPCTGTSAIEFCNLQPCPTNCQLSQWSAFSDCDKTCLTGTKMRSRIIITDATHGGAACHGTRMQYKDCNMGSCPVNCRVSLWGHYGACSATCGTGLKTRTRKVVVLHDTKGAKCPPLKMTHECNTNLCAVDCIVGKWSEWKAGETNYEGHAVLIKTREIIVQPWAGGKQCPKTKMKRSWVSHCNSIKKQHEQYGKWSECDSTGHKYRYRIQVKCVHNAVMRMHMKFRETQACTSQVASPVSYMDEEPQGSLQ